MGAPNCLREVYFLPARFFLRRGKRKSHRGLYQENRVVVLEKSPCSLKFNFTHLAL